MSQETCRRLLIDAIPGGMFRGEVRPFGVQVRSPVSHHRIARWSTDGLGTMPLSIVRSDGPDALDASDCSPLSADLVVVSLSDAELARYARAWSNAGQTLPKLYLANLARLSIDQHFLSAAVAARGMLIHLAHSAEEWRDGIDTLTAVARDRRIALAVIADQPDPRLDAMSNLPRSTLRRLASLCKGSDEAAARAVLTQLSLAAGLTIAPWLDQPAQPTAEPIREAVR
ncbi:hypothetical protein ACTZWT_11875 [Rhodopseudomonas sp. NSM]|uniref:hypothetical protein n=1 Tax=Rhodopseudomonas sp. NSM TaxID=3457630 RepID=UPI0040371C3A